MLTQNIDISNHFNNYFSDIGYKMAQEILQNSKDNQINSTESKNGGITNTIFLYPVSESEIKNSILELKMNSVPGHDNIKSSTLKEMLSYIIEPLQYIVNLIFQQGKFPDVKKSIVKPIFKQGDPKNVSNYRPISIISNIAKIVEKCIKSRLLEHLNKYNIISPSQYGFRDGLSTTDAMHATISQIHNSLNSGSEAFGDLFRSSKGL